MYDLPSEDPEEPGLPDEFHELQPQLLRRSLRLSNYQPDQFFIGSDLNLYYDLEHPLWHKRPDWFLAVGVSRLYAGQDLRRSYVIWQERRNPFVVVELLSPGTESEDLGIYAESDLVVKRELPREEIQNGGEIKDTPPSKWEVYEKILRIPYYIVFSRYTNRVQFFQLVGGQYQEQLLDAENPRIWIPELEIALGLWEGEFEGISRLWLRWCDSQGNWMPTDAEQERTEKEQALQQVEQALQQVEQERTQKEQALQQLEQALQQLRQVAQNLLQSGIAIAQVSQVTGLPETEIQKLQDP
jgi:Uma2 family endonuclease/exonuclease VII small subunit